MHTIGEYVGASRNLEGDLVISFAIDDIDISKLLPEVPLVIDIKKYNPKRSINANNYFWQLCTQIAQVLGSDKDTVYLMQLGKYGSYVDVEVVKEAKAAVVSKFRYVEDMTDILDQFKDTVLLRCYFGSSHYDTKEMSTLIDGTVNDAKDLGIEVWTDEEIDNLIKNWKGDT